MIWLMGVWKRSARGRENALKYKHEYRNALPDVTDDDVIGSAYAMGDYVGRRAHRRARGRWQRCASGSRRAGCR